MVDNLIRFRAVPLEDNFGLSMINGNPAELPPPPLPLATDGGEGSDQFLTLEYLWKILVVGYGVGFLVGVAMGYFF